MYTALLLLFAAVNFTGAWKLNEKASGTTAGGPHEIVWKIEQSETKFKYSATGKRGYMPFSEAYELPTVWDGDALVLKYVKDGREFARFTLRMSADGKQMTREGTVGSTRIREIYDRQ